MAGWRFGDPPPPSAGADAYASFLKDFQDWQRVLGDPDALIGRPNVEIIVTEDGDPYFCEGFRLAAIGLHHRECAEFACKFLGKQLKNPQRSAWGAAGSDGACSVLACYGATGKPVVEGWGLACTYPNSLAFTRNRLIVHAHACFSPSRGSDSPAIMPAAW
jgi:hypothetical protein